MNNWPDPAIQEDQAASEPAPPPLTPEGSTFKPVANEAEATPAAAQPAGDVKVSTFDTVQLNVRDADLSSILQLLSVQGRRNIVPSPNVSGKVTANLYDVTFHEALDAILQQNGAGYIEKGNFIYVYTMAELQKIQKVERKVAFKIFKLNYLTAGDASEFVKPLMSGAGSMSMTGDVSAGFQPSIGEGGADSDAHSHVLIVRDYPEVLEEVAKIIAELDVPPKQVLIESTILRAKVDETLAFGVDFSLLSNIHFDELTDPLSGVNDLLAGSPNQASAAVATSTVGGVGSGKGGLKVGIMSGDVAFFIRALDSVVDTTILANPKLLVLNRQRGDVLVGEKVGYLSTTSTSTSTTQTVEYLDTGTKLTVRPFVTHDGNIRMELKPSISEPDIKQLNQGAGQVTVPNEITAELTSNVMVRDGQTVVLGGLFREETEITRNQIPGVGDIPIVGNLAKGRDDTFVRTEVIFLITPHIVKDKALYAAGKSTSDALEMVRFGAREGLLPWSRSKMIAGHMRDALRHLDAEDTDRALWEVDLALALDPRSTEAIRLKEKLVGHRTYWSRESLLDEMVDVVVDRQLGYTRQQMRTTPMKPDPAPTIPEVPAYPPLPEDKDAGSQADEPETETVPAKQTPTAEEPAAPAEAVTEVDPQTQAEAQPVSDQAQTPDEPAEQVEAAQVDAEPTELPMTLAELDAQIEAERAAEQERFEQQQAEAGFDEMSDEDIEWGASAPLTQAPENEFGSFEDESSESEPPLVFESMTNDPWAEDKSQNQPTIDADAQVQAGAEAADEQAAQDIDGSSEPVAGANQGADATSQALDPEAQVEAPQDGALPAILLQAIRAQLQAEPSDSQVPADATADVPTDEPMESK